MTAGHWLFYPKPLGSKVKKYSTAKKAAALLFFLCSVNVKMSLSSDKTAAVSASMLIALAFCV